MQRSETYNTKQKDIIIDLIKNKKSEFTVKDIYEELKGKTGLTTIYRLVDKLINDGLLTKNIDSNNITYYQYLEKCSHENHFYLKCTNCKQMIHIDCDCITDLVSHIYKEHNFSPNQEHIIIEGICSNCSKEI